MTERPWRPTRAQIEAARGRAVPDVIRPGLSVLFCDINPSLYSAAVGHHFARPGNRFWPALYGAGFTDRLLLPNPGGLNAHYQLPALVERFRELRLAAPPGAAMEKPTS